MAVELKVAKADQAQAPGADLQHVNAFWVGLLHQLLKLGLIRRCDSQAPDQALAVQLTMAGVRELDGLVAAGNKHMQAQHMGALDGSGLRSTRLSCSKALVQSLMQPLGEHSREEKGLDGQVAFYPLQGFHVSSGDGMENGGVMQYAR